MDEALNGIVAWSFGLATLVYALFSLHLRLAWRGGKRGMLLLAATGLSLAWSVAGLGLALSNAWVAWVLADWLDCARCAAWCFFLFSLLTPEGVALPASLLRVRRVVVGVFVVRALIDCTTAVGLGGSGFAAQAYIVAALGSAIGGLVCVEQLYRSFPVESRWGIKPLCVGLAATFFFDVYVFADAFMFHRIDFLLWGVRGLATVLAVPLVAMSAARSRDWAFRISLSREVVFHSASLATAGIFLLAVAAAGYWVRYFGGEWGRALQALLLVGALLGVGVVLFSGSFRARMRVVLAKHFFSYRYDYRAEWLRFTQALAASGASSDLATAVIRGLADFVESPGGLLWMRDRSGHFVMSGRLNHAGVEATEAIDGGLAAFLVRRQWIVDLEQWRSRPSMYEGLALPPWLEDVPDAWLIIPLFAGGELVGFVVLLTARAPVEMDWEVLDLLKTAARQAAVYLARIQTSEALLEAQKFDSFNRMSAFVVHDLKNLVAQLQLMLKNADRHRDNPEFQQDMLDTVRHVQERMKSLMSQLQEKRSIDPRRPVGLLELAARIAASKRHQRPEVKIEGDGQVEVMAHAERIERIIGHLVQNALDATADDGIVAVRVYGDSGNACVEVSDTGCGMSPQFVRERLFKPFQTTKEAGMGIGAFETLQYVSELEGRIDVESEPGRGTSMKVWLPRVNAGAAAVVA